MSKAIKQMQQVLDDIEHDNKCKSMEVDDKDRQHEETINFATWKTNEPMLESERERLKNNLECGLSMLQPLELCAIFQVVSDAIREAKIKELKEIQKTQNLNFDIEIDGGINFDNSKKAIEAGANILVSGTTIFKSNNGDIKKNIELLKSK